MATNAQVKRVARNKKSARYKAAVARRKKYKAEREMDAIQTKVGGVDRVGLNRRRYQ